MTDKPPQNNRSERKAVENRQSDPSSSSDETYLLNRSHPSPTSLPKKIGHYTIKRVIASGGMGVVYEAMQENPRRTVALKVMKEGIVSTATMRRFEYESLFLARLQHPHIAQVYQAGTHQLNQETVPFFAMEYIPNAKPITEYALDRLLSTTERLELFTQVCDAVYHGHQKGIIHRDLKPGNILVDPHGQVKIIDFGLARSTDSDMALTTLQTDVGQLIGTLQYMSPEQCEADPHDIDTRSDVYALGVVLYELLSGQLPYEVMQKAIHEVIRIIREEHPRRLSSVNRRLKGDVETITLKALQKDRERRYQSAVELVQDIRRYLAGEAIVGRPPSFIYQLKVFARRHQALFISLITIFAVLSGGLLLSSVMYLRSERARSEAEAVTRFLSDTLAAVDPTAASSRDITVKEMLDQTAQDIGKSFADQPLVEARLRHTIGKTYMELGKYATAEEHLQVALSIRMEKLGEKHPDTLSIMNNLAGLYARQGRYEEAEPLNIRTLELCRQVHGDEHEETLEAMFNLATLSVWQGRFEEAESLYLTTLEIQRRVLGEEHRNTLNTMNNLANLYDNLGRFEESEALYLETLETQTRVLGVEHPYTLATTNNLAVIYKLQGRYDDAERLSLKTIESYGRVLGPEHPHTLSSMNNLAVLYKNQEKYESAEPLYTQVLQIRRRVLGDEHPETLISMNNLAKLLLALNRYDEAESLALSAVEGARRSLPEGHRFIGMFLSAHGMCLTRLKRFAEAETSLLEAHDILTATLGPDHKKTVQTGGALVELYTGWGKSDKAARWRDRLSSS